jgi:hypothetical protein
MANGDEIGKRGSASPEFKMMVVDVETKSGFSIEPGFHLGVVGEVRWKDFDGDGAVQACRELYRLHPFHRHQWRTGFRMAESCA